MAARKRTIRPKTNGVKKKRISATRRRGESARIFGILIPLFFIACIVFCLGFLLLMGYRTVTASTFFDAKTIDVRGTNRVSRDDVERIVRSQTEKNGVWNANLETIRNDVEKFAYVKSVAVSRVLPNTIQVRVDERIPKAIARLNNGADVWVDDDAQILGKVEKNDTRPDFILRGWDESKTERAQKENQERVKCFVKMQDDFQKSGVANRVTSIVLNDLQDPQATIEDSGKAVNIFLGKEDYGKRLQRALDVIGGKGNQIESLISHGAGVTAKYRE
ncbi:MAG: cell division protein FtsQ/DivIB [Pyrinomonadaceae bacterium]